MGPFSNDLELRVGEALVNRGVADIAFGKACSRSGELTGCISAIRTAVMRLLSEMLWIFERVPQKEGFHSRFSQVGGRVRFVLFENRV